MLGCLKPIYVILWLSGEPVGPYWKGMGVKVWEMLHGLEVEGQKVWVLPRGLGVKARKCGFYHTDWGVLWTKK
jgi:hypothetical protein